MKRYSFLVYHRQYTEFLDKVRETGVLHVIEKPEGIAENDALREKMQLAARTKTVINRIEKLIPKGAILKTETKENAGLELLINIENKFSAKESLEQKLQLAERDRERMEVWGKFSHERIQQLRNAGFVLNFFSCNLRKFDQEWEVLYNAFEIDTVGTTRYFVTVTKPGEPVEIDADPVKLSSNTAEQLDVLINDYRAAIENEKSELVNLAVENKLALKEFQAQVIGDIDYSKVLLHTRSEADDKVMLLEGWCPEESENQLNTYLDASGIYYETTIPTEEDKVPVKLKNNKFAKLYEMIGELYDMPNYHELDLTPFFAPFYMLFFGLCLGDAGYGFILVLVAIFARSKVKPSLKPILSLLAWLGGATVILGTISGTFFGYNLLESEIPWLESIKKFMLNPDQLFYTALIIGVVQIMFGMIIKAVGKMRRFGLADSLSTWGWIIAILGCGGTYLFSSYGGIQPEIAKWAYIISGGIGGLLIFVLNDIKRNPLINIGAGLWDTYNMATGLLGDVLSYIRLFALGISGAVMGFVFNDLAIQLSGDIPVVSPIIMIVIMLIGHSINIFMSGLSAFVHPMRLTFVEFYKNSGFEGGGKKYKPFAQYKEEESLF
ncbi:MAG TPA: V-type ATPase 116kDa subunit family protein [Paludibacter sp.]|nr:V-type ATPase 116kDa subunit family protein [Paludibacter sp.]